MLRLVVGGTIGVIVPVAILIHGSLEQGAILTQQTWPVFVVVGAPIALLGFLGGMLLSLFWPA